MNGCSLQLSKYQTEEEIKAPSAGLDRNLDTLGLSLGRFENSRQLLFVTKIRLNCSFTIHRNHFCSKSPFFGGRRWLAD